MEFMSPYTPAPGAALLGHRSESDVSPCPGANGGGDRS